MDEDEKLTPIFEQSWEYIRHSQNMFWQSFTALFSVIVGILLLISSKEDSEIWIIGVTSSMTLALIGFFVCNRTVRVLREHFLTINNVRKQLKIDDKTDLIPTRWKRYKIEDFGMASPEIIYIFIASILYLVVFLSLVSYFVFHVSYFVSLPLRYFLSIIGMIFTLILLGFYAWEQAYRLKEKVNMRKTVHVDKGK